MNEIQKATDDVLQRMIRFYSLCPENKQAMEFVKECQKELEKRNANKLKHHSQTT
jgi:hypothetical protein